MGFHPGLVGGHCIGVDPYYFIYQAEILGYHSQIMAAGRRVNDNMPIFVTDNVIRKLIQSNKNVKQACIYVMGITFKEDCPDMRNSKAVEVCKQLSTYGVNIKVVDPVVEKAEFNKEFSMELTNIEDVQNADCLIFLVAHRQFQELSPMDFARMLKPQDPQTEHVIVDIKNIFKRKDIEEKGYSYWSL
ncbi:UDP-N-acetyl-D-mannosamine dehydrogenase [bioreactor metagenome]|uniref:UDP-N-acetyl-D-mannosamine dehydrogenase n=1 Tax=bioreactor metagenome TaxID=1076179 RepID=A0A645HUX2_9ZZZZ